MEHVPGQLDFSIVEKEFPVTAFLRKISSICAFVETPGHVAVITRRGKRECALVSIETYDRADRADDPGLYQRRHVRHHRYHILDATLRLTLATWESETNSLSANFLKAVARIIAVFGDSLREDIFKEHVGRCSVKSIIRTAKERRPGVLGYAEAMLIAYNNKNKYRLPIKKLYGSQRDEEIDDEETDDDTTMKMIFKELFLFSPHDKLAKRIEFQEGINIITSSQIDGNDKGKSVIMRSFYRSFQWNRKRLSERHIHILRVFSQSLSDVDIRSIFIEFLNICDRVIFPGDAGHFKTEPFHVFPSISEILIVFKQHFLRHREIASAAFR